MSAILSFLGGSAFRLIWGQISDYLTERQNHSQEMQRMRLQAEIDAAQHDRSLSAVRLQAELGVQTIRVRGEAESDVREMDGWAAAVATANRPSGIWLVDLLNGLIRPAAAFVAIMLWVVALNAQGFSMIDWDRELVGVILGFYFATRVLTSKRG